MLTKQDINELQETFATKDDLKNNQIDLKKEIQELKEELRANTNATTYHLHCKQHFD
jgi:hypothetical protein